MTTSNLVETLKAAGQDHEFYPTTNEIIHALVRDVKWHGAGGKNASVLDIGAGNGKVLKALKELAGFTDLHAIEKSPILCQQLPAEVLVVGTKFEEQSLLSKSVDVIFSNPPYSDFEAWGEKIIREASAKVVYLVLPVRWENSPAIKDALKFRDASGHVVGKFTFEDSEDRQARANVHLLRVDLHRGEKDSDDAFERFFNQQFADLIGRYAASEPKPAEGEEKDSDGGGRRRPFHNLVVGPNYPEALVNLYRQEMGNIERNYKLVGELDVELLREFDIAPAKIMACLKSRLGGLRNDYWNELFSHLTAVTDRLTSKSRKKLLGTLQKHVQVDFTVSNIYEVVIWVIKNANAYIDAQLLETYAQMVDKCNVQLYKSNQRVWVDDRWRYNGEPEKNSHYALDYRIVAARMGGMHVKWRGEELDERASEFLGDLLTIARNLGFNCSTVSDRLGYHGRDKWTAGTTEDFYFTSSKSGEPEKLFEVRAFKNGNLHLRLNKAFILALNVEHGRLRGWLKNGDQAADELRDPEAAQYFTSNLQIGGNPLLLLK